MGLSDEKACGFTLMEVLLALAITGVLAGMVFSTFRYQQNAFVAEQAAAALIQNLRGGLHLMGTEIRMAGLLTGLDRASHDFIDWDPTRPGTDSLTAVMGGVDNISGITDYREGSDLVAIVKASVSDRGLLEPGEGAAAGSTGFVLRDLDLDGDGDDDLNAKVNGKNYGVLVKGDLGGAQLFRIVRRTASTVGIEGALKMEFGAGDIIARVDILVFSVDDANPLFPEAVLTLRNVGSGNRRQVIAENISDLQVEYRLEDGTEVSDPVGLERRVGTVTIILTGTSTVTGYRVMKRKLSSTIMLRNR